MRYVSAAMSRLLLKYLARDEVALLGRGTGGVSEVRSTIEGYHDKSPLYGFLQYRRRKVVLKFVPEGISRLLQGMQNAGASPDGQYSNFPDIC